MNLKELKNKIEEIEITYDYDETYSNLYNTCIEYMNETQDFDCEYLFEDFVDYEMAEDRAKNELENYGLERLTYFLGDTTFYMQNLFRINAYGNLENITKEDLDILKEDLIDYINNKLESEEQ